MFSDFDSHSEKVWFFSESLANLLVSLGENLGMGLGCLTSTLTHPSLKGERASLRLEESIYRVSFFYFLFLNNYRVTKSCNDD